MASTRNPVTKKLAEFIVKTGFGDFDQQTVSVGKNLVFDSIGAMIRGSRETVSQIMMRHATNTGGIAEVGAIGGGFRTSITNAALINGTSAHSAEQEAVGKFGGSCTFVTAPAALCVAEKFGYSGKSVLEGFIIGQEVQGRIGMGCKGGSNRGWSSVYYPLGAAAVASKMMNLNVDQTRVALSIAASYQGGNWRLCGTMMHFGETGFACEMGIRAALLAKESMTSDPEMIEGENGFADWLGESDLNLITKDLGNPFYIISPGSAVKKYGCCYGMHRALDALTQLIDEHDIYYDQVESVGAVIPKFVTRLLHYPDPQNAEQSKFSLEHALGAGIVDRKITLEVFSEAGVTNPKFKEARKKVKVDIIDQEGGRTLVGKEIPVTIKLKDGRSFTRECAVLKGGPESPLTKEDLVQRYKGHVQGIISSQQTQRSIDLAFDLEKLPNVRELMELATFGYVEPKKAKK